MLFLSLNHLYDMSDFGACKQYPQYTFCNKVDVSSVFAVMTKNKLPIFQTIQSDLLVISVYDVLLYVHYENVPVIDM